MIIWDLDLSAEDLEAQAAVMEQKGKIYHQPDNTNYHSE
jgi:uncharacterized protein YaiI (UPF0178 family)